MFACLYLPPPANSIVSSGPRAEREGGSPSERPTTHATLVQLARDFSPRVETHGDRTVTLDISGLGSLIGEPRSIGEELRRTAADAGLRVHIAVASTSTAAILLAHARAGLTVVARGDEATTLAPLPLESTRRGFGLSDSRLAARSLQPRARVDPNSSAGVFALSAIWRRFRRASCPPGFGQAGLALAAMGARRRDAAARAGRRRRAVRGIARSRVAHRRARAVVVCAGAPVRSACASGSSAAIAVPSRCTSR